MPPLVSIVIPVYNEAEYIEECIQSIVAQSYRHWNCTIVNNCSTDASAEIAQPYVAKDSRIRIHNNPGFLSAIANHNSALRQICPDSKYCKLVFADDWLFPECLERMVALAEEHTSVGIVGAYGIQGRYVMWAGLPYTRVPISGRDICRKLFLDGLYAFGTGTSVMFRTDLVRARDPFYNEANTHSDSETCIALLRTCDFGFVHQVLTFTRERKQSRTAISESLNTLIAGRLYELVIHGQDYLSPDEFNSCLERILSKYYEFLAHNLVAGRDKHFWEYHGRKFTDAGISLSWVRLAIATMSISARHPRSTLKTLIKGRLAKINGSCREVGIPLHIDYEDY